MQEILDQAKLLIKELGNFFFYTRDLVIKPSSFSVKYEKITLLQSITVLLISAAFMILINLKINSAIPPMVSTSDGWLILLETEEERQNLSSNYLNIISYADYCVILFYSLLAFMGGLLILTFKRLKKDWLNIGVKLTIVLSISSVLNNFGSLLMVQLARWELISNGVFFIFFIIIGAWILYTILIPFLVIRSLVTRNVFRLIVLFLIVDPILIGLVLLFDPVSIYNESFVQSKKIYKSSELTKEADTLIAAAEYSKAILLLKESQKLQPHNLSTDCSLLLAYSHLYLNDDENKDSLINEMENEIDIFSDHYAEYSSGQLYAGKMYLIIDKCEKAKLAFRLANNLPQSLPHEKAYALWALHGLTKNNDLFPDTDDVFQNTNWFVDRSSFKSAVLPLIRIYASSYSIVGYELLLVDLATGFDTKFRDGIYLPFIEQGDYLLSAGCIEEN